MRSGLSVILFWIAAPILGAFGDEPAPRLELRPGDRIVFLGSGLIEQERRFGYLETRLSRRVPEGSLTFRNLGWAGDTVRGIARTDGYQNQAGFARLLKEVQDWKPTVIFIGYGTNESFDGAAGLPGFRADYAGLLAKLAPLKARVVLLSPIYQEDLGRPFPDPAAHNRDVDNYVAAIRELAEKHKSVFVDLTKPLEDKKTSQLIEQLTTNGLQLNETGSLLVAHVIEDELGLPLYSRVWEIDSAGKALRIVGTRLDKFTATREGIKFQLTDKMVAVHGDVQAWRVVGLPRGEYSLKIDGKPVSTMSSDDSRIAFASHVRPNEAEKLRKAIIANNETFYRRWRPFNDHSRHWGFIGGDFKLYDREMEAQEKTIAELRRPRPHQYEIIRIGESK
jgi:GDSL-like Lipase/Acylhydrolase family